MTGFLGQVPDEVQSLAGDFRAKADEIESIISDITTRFQGTTWRGDDRESFEASWSGEMTNTLTQLAAALRDAGTVADKNAEQQITASSA